MTLKIRSAGGLPSQKDCDYASKRLDHLSRLVRRVEDAEIVHKEERHGRRVDVVVKSGGRVFRGSSTEVDTRTALESSLVKIEAQMRRDHARKTDHAQARGKRSVPDESGPDHAVPEDSGHVVDTKVVSLRPMTLSEATLAFETSKMPIFPFHNVETQRSEVVYRHDKGGLAVMRLR